LYIPNEFTFLTSYRYSYIEPMDVIYVTTSSLWAANGNNVNLGVNVLPVRITKVVDNPDGTLEFTCEDYPFGIHEPTIYNKDIAAGEPLPNTYAEPGYTKAVMLLATPQLADYKKNQLWIGAAGESEDWGGCNVWVSMDGSTYAQVGTIEEAARIGNLAANLLLGTDPDTTHSMVVQLIDTVAGLESGTTADADQNNTICAVGGELIAFSTIALTGQNTYTASGYLRRGLLGTTPPPHTWSARTSSDWTRRFGNTLSTRVGPVKPSR
jgi:hypothetical protein